MARNLRPKQSGPDAYDLGHIPLPEGLVLQVPGVPPRELDDNEPTPTRQAELRTAYQENIAAGRSPYADVTIQTRGELFWIMSERDWSGDFDAEGKERANLSDAHFTGTDWRDVSLVEGDLRQANLSGANLSGATLSRANIQDATLMHTDLSGADLGGVRANRTNLMGADLHRAFISAADLSDAHLEQADLCGAYLQHVNLRQATLYGAKMAGTNLRWADLCGADLTTTSVDKETILADIKIDSRTLFGDVAWNGVPLMQVNWEPISRIGDEVRAKEPLWEQPGQGKKGRKPRDERIREYQRAARTYRSLALALKEQGLTRLAVSFHHRAERMDCYALFHDACMHSPGRRLGRLCSFFSAYLRWLKSCVLYGFIWLSAHRGWLLCLYLAIVFGFMIVYWGVGLQAHTGITLSEALVLSLTSFHGRGLPPATGLNDPMRMAAGIEAVCGLLIEALFIAAFTRRVMSS